MFKFLILISLGTLMAGSIYVIDEQSVQLTAPTEQPAAQDRICATGNVEGASRDIELRAEISGRVIEVLVAEGDWVEKGDVLVRLDGRRQVQQVAASQANLELSEAQLERLTNGARAEERSEANAMIRAKQAQLVQAKRSWDRINELREQGAISQQEADNQQGLVERLRAELEAAQARSDQITAPARADEVRVASTRVTAAEAELALAQLVLEKTELQAPCQGCVLNLDIEVGEIVDPKAMTPYSILSDTSILKVRAFIEEIDAPRVKIGMPAVIVADGLPGQNFQGSIVQCSPRMARKFSYSDRADEMYDTKVREVIIE
jgi:multidrug resistance efflux pump